MPLFGTVGPQVQAWAARAPLTSPSERTGFADRAATLGVFSNAAMVDLYGSIYDATDASDRSGTVANDVRLAYTGEPAARLAALRSLWKPTGDPYYLYARQILTARASALIPRDACIGDGDVDWLVAQSGMSARSVERLSRRLYGAPPKLLARKYRALGAAVRLGTGEAATWADAAGDAFYDQAHFIREFRAFTGKTPARFLAEVAPITRLTLTRRRLVPGLPKLTLFA